MTAFYVGTVSKYHNRRTTVDNIEFASKREADFYQTLKFMLKAGTITDLQLQLPFGLQPPFVDYTGKKQREIKYICDFAYKDKNGKLHVVDCKGVRTPLYILKKKMFLYQYPQFIFEEV